MNLKIFQGDALAVLKTLPECSVQCCVTSPPYWGLRDYGVDGQLGLEKTPEEYVAKMVAVFAEVRRVLREDGTLWLNLGSSYFSDPAKGGSGTFNGRNGYGESYARGKLPIQSRSGVPACGSDGKEPQCSTATDSAYSDLCDGCRAALLTGTGSTCLQPEQSPPPVETKGHDNGRSDFGKGVAADALPSVLESTTPQFSQPPQAGCRHCANCGACLSVLRSASRDARLCARKAQCSSGTSSIGSECHNQDRDALVKACPNLSMPSLNFKPKDLVPIPWMVAMALQQDGFYLRQEIIWHKPNTMPESVTDRCTKSHEYIFMLTKSAHYFFDAEAIKTPPSEVYANDSRWDTGGTETNYKEGYSEAMAQNPKMPHRVFNGDKPSGINRRSVWTVPSAPYSGAHFATFPPDLIKPCILSGTSARGCCPKCGAPWERIVERSGGSIGHSWHDHSVDLEQGQRVTDPTAKGSIARCKDGNGQEYRVETKGWEPGCECGFGELQPCTVLDPFFGSGTSGMVALELGRKCIGIELNPKYIELAKQRCDVTQGLALA